MSRYQKKYLSLRDASIVSGYTAAELRNFCKIGLIPFRKTKNKLFIRFDAFEKIQEHNTAVESKIVAPKSKPARQKTMKILEKSSLKSVVPFTTPNRQLVKILEPIAFAAALVMTLHVAMLPEVSNKIVFGIEVSESAVATLSESAQSLIAQSIEVPVAVGAKIASLPVLPQEPTIVSSEGVVAGEITENNQQSSSQSVTVEEGAGSGVTAVLISIADASDSFQRFLDHLDQTTNEVLIESLTFDRLDPVIQTVFRW